MSSILERRLATFVNRERELGRFRAALDASDSPVMAIWGGPGRGKQHLMYRLQKECLDREVSDVRVIWRPNRGYDYVNVMTQIADRCGEAHFAEFFQLKRRFDEADRQLSLTVGTEGGVGVLSDATIEDSTVGDVTGVRIDNVTINAPHNELRRIELDRMIRLTGKFVDGLSRASAASKIAVILYAFDQAADETKSWLWSTVMEAVEDERIGDVVLVVFTEEEPEIDVDIADFVDAFELPPLERPHVADLMRRKGLDLADDQLASLAERLMQQLDNNLDEIANAIDSMVRQQIGTGHG